MKKSIWISALEKDEPRIKPLFETAHRYGLDTGGHFWEDNLDDMAWSAVAPELLKPETSLWIITGSLAGLQTPSIRFGLSMLAVMLHDRKGHGFPILVVPQPTDAAPLPPDALQTLSLPTPLKDADLVLPAQLGAKVAAKANIPLRPVPAAYRLRAYPVPKLGLWLELGPAGEHVWQGVLCGVQDAEIDAHGVGPEGKLPDRCVLEYPMQGLTLQQGEASYTAWAVKNTLQAGDSYYVRVRGMPKGLIFGELPEGDEAEVYTLGLV